MAFRLWKQSLAKNDFQKTELVKKTKTMKDALRRMVGKKTPKTSPERSSDREIQKTDDTIARTPTGVPELSAAEIAQKLKERASESTDTIKESPQISGESLIQAIFAGAPQFSVAKVDGQYFPSVGFPWDKSLEIRDASDCVPLQHPAFSASTTYSHLVPGFKCTRNAPEYAIGINEVPNMLSATGTEPGTIGYVHYLEEPLSDTFAEDRSEELDQNSSEAIERKEDIRSAPEKVGIRKFNAEVVGERLKELGAMFREYQTTAGKVHILKKDTDGEMYTKLFTQL